MKVTVKRFEGPYVVCMKEDGGVIDIKRINVPKNTKEGCILDVINNQCIEVYDTKCLSKV